MEILRATEILKTLSDGVNPFTGELLPNESVCNHAEVVRAFHCILEELKKNTKKPKKASPENAGKPWGEEDDKTLAQMFEAGYSIQEMKMFFKRTAGAIESRLEHIGKIPKNK